MLARMRLAVVVGAGAAALVGGVSKGRADAVTASSASFVVMAPDRGLAERVAQRAEDLRSEISRRWLGDEPEAPARKAGIHLTLDASRASAKTSLHDNGETHLTWIVGAPDDCTGYLLAHEVAHTVLARRFGSRMPAWANEGIACQYDDRESRAIRADILRGFVAHGDWPNLAEVLTESVQSQREYAAAVSVTEFLMSLDDSQGGPPEGLFTFVEDGARLGWDHALRTHYSMRGLRHLQREWQAWVRARVRAPDERVASHWRSSPKPPAAPTTLLNARRR